VGIPPSSPGTVLLWDKCATIISMCACTAVGAAPAPLDSTFAPCGVHRLEGALHGRHLVTRVGGHVVQHAWRFRSYQSVDQRHVLVVPCRAHVIALIVSHRYRPLFFPPGSLPPFPPSHRRALVNCIYIHMLLRSSEYSPPSIIFSVWMLHLLPAAIATMSASCDRPCTWSMTCPRPPPWISFANASQTCRSKAVSPLQCPPRLLRRSSGSWSRCGLRRSPTPTGTLRS